MSFFSNMVKKYNRATPKQLVLVGVFMLALAGAIGAGFAARGTSTAATFRGDCDNNAIMKCGAVNAATFCSKYGTNNGGTQKDLPAIYKSSKVGLTLDDCKKYFAKEAKVGAIYRNGDIKLANGELITNGAHSMGRQNFNNSKPLKIGDTTYYYGTPSQRWASGVKSIPVMVWFDSKTGMVKTMIMNPCGNPVPVYNKPSVECKTLNTHPVDGKANTYRFSATASKDSHGLAKIVKFKYYVDGKLVDTTTSAATKTKEIKLTKTSTVKVEVEYTLPGSRGKVRTITSKLCERKIEVKQEKFEYACKDLYATTKDNKTFRFNVKASHSSNVKLVSADFTLNGNATTKGVTQKNDKGEIYTDYTFDDGKTHTVTAVLNFEYTIDGKVHKVQSKELCKTQVTSKKPPVCPHNPNLPPEHPDCKKKEKECKPGIPVGDERCEEKKEECKPGIPKGDERCKDYCKPGIEVGSKDCEEEPTKEVLPVTGPAGIAGMFAGVTVAGAISHRLFSNFRSRN